MENNENPIGIIRIDRDTMTAASGALSAVISMLSAEYPNEPAESVAEGRRLTLLASRAKIKFEQAIATFFVPESMQFSPFCENCNRPIKADTDDRTTEWVHSSDGYYACSRESEWSFECASFNGSTLVAESFR